MNMKKRILLAAVVLFCAMGFAQAQESELQGSVDLTFQSKYLWRGFDVFHDDTSAIQPSLDLEGLFGTGLGINVMGHRANSSGFEDAERWDYKLYYKNGLFQGEAYALDYELGWVYYNFPQRNAADADLQEIHTILSLPEMCPAGIVPSYSLVKLWPSYSGSMVGSKSPQLGGTASGWLHIFRLGYPLTVGGILPDTPEQVLNLSAEVIYNDGISLSGQNVDEVIYNDGISLSDQKNVDHDWSNAVFGISTGFDLSEGLVLTPGIYHQITMDSSVNDDKSETWVTLSMTYNF